MFELVQAILPKGNPRNPVLWRRASNSMATQIRTWTQRLALQAPVNNRAVALLRYVALYADPEYLLTIQDDRALYNNHIVPKLSGIRNTVDPIRGTVDSSRTFVAAYPGVEIPELHVCTFRANAEYELPYGQPWSKWRPLRCVKIISHDSLELAFNTANSRIKFHRLPPTMFVVAIDAPLLVMRFIKWLRTNRTIDDDIGALATAYIQQQIVLPWANDMFRIWTSNVIATIISGNLPTIQPLMPPAISSMAPLFQAATNEVDEFVGMVRNQTIRVEDFLATKWIMGRSFFEVIESLDQRTKPPNLRQYNGVRFMMQYPYLRVITQLAQASGWTASSQPLRQRLRYDLLTLRRSNAANNLRQPGMAATMTRQLDELLEKTDRRYCRQ